MQYATQATLSAPSAPNPSHVPSQLDDDRVRNEAHSSGVSWAAVIAGAFVAAALSLILLALGTGLGLSSISPWSGIGASASAISAGAIVWLMLMQFMSCSMGGYIAGRLRTKWAHLHTDEVYFRDTAHGFLVWGVGLVLTASFLATAAATMIGGNAHSVGASAAVAANSGTSSGEATGVRAIDPNEYFIDSLFRSATVTPNRNDADARREASLIFANGLRHGNIPEADKSYLVQLVSANTGLNGAEASSRVSSVFTQAQQAADTARRALAHLSLWLFAALLIGAFCASFAATIGGRQRDHVQLV